MAEQPTQRTLKHCRALGEIADVVERWVGSPHGHRTRRDMFGFGDIVTIRHNEICIIQCTSAANVSSRVAKIENECHYEASRWLKFGAIEVWGWKKYKQAIDRRYWRPHIVRFEL